MPVWRATPTPRDAVEEIAMQLPQIAPLTVPAVVRAMAELGVEHDPIDVRSLLIDSAGLTLEVIARTGDGTLTTFGDEVASHTIRVPWAPIRSIVRDGHSG